MDDEAIRHLLVGLPTLSFVTPPHGFVAISRDRVVESQGEDVAREVDAWAQRVGGTSRMIEQPESRGLRSSRRVAPDPGPPTMVWDIPRETLREPHPKD